jgi:hypothetical protein
MSSAYFDRPVLIGRYVRLEPLTLQHAEGLLEAGKDPEVWTWLSTRQPTDMAAMRTYVARLLSMHEARALTPWAQVDTRTSIIDSEWPTARDALRARLRQSATPAHLARRT